MVLNDVLGYKGMILVYDELAGLGVNLMGGAAVYNLLDYDFPLPMTQTLRERGMGNTGSEYIDLADGLTELANRVFRVQTNKDYEVAYNDVSDAVNLVVSQSLRSNEIMELDSRIIKSWQTDNNLTLNDASIEDIQNARDKHFGGAALDEFILDRTRNFLQATNLFIKTISNG